MRFSLLVILDCDQAISRTRSADVGQGVAVEQVAVVAVAALFVLLTSQRRTTCHRRRKRRGCRLRWLNLPEPMTNN